MASDQSIFPFQYDRDEEEQEISSNFWNIFIVETFNKEERKQIEKLLPFEGYNTTRKIGILVNTKIL